ncbi:MAG TPA: DMT family transporter [Burkholderiales bacterium]|nr:DMT family transporter [Burkholderiales bacterium]
MSTQHTPNFGIGVTLALLAAVGFSAKAIFVKLAYFSAPIDAITLLALRMAFSVPVFIGAAIWSSRQPGAKTLHRRDWLLIVGLGCIGYYLSSLLDFMGLKYLNAGLERLILFLYPTMTVLLSAAIFKHPVSRRHIVALVISYAGIALAFAHQLTHRSNDMLLGAGLVFASTFSYSAYLTGAGHAIRRIGTIRFTSLTMTVASAITLAHFTATHTLSALHLPGRIYGLGLGMAVFSTVLPVFMLSASIRIINPGRTALIGSIGPVATIFMGYLFLNETIDRLQIAGSILVLAGVLLISLSSQQRSAPAPATEIPAAQPD